MFKKIFHEFRNRAAKYYLNSGNQLREKIKFEQAIKQYQKSLKINPNFIPSLLKLAQIYYDIEDLNSAFTYYQKILQIKPNHIGAQMKLAEILRIQGNFEEARVACKKAMALQLQAGIVNRTTVIQKLIERMGAKTYLEIGVYQGLNFLQIEVENKIAVDPKLRIPGGYNSEQSNQYYEITSDDFFATKSEILINQGLDVVFVDGLHTYEQSLKDVLNSLKFLNNNGVIVMHDCNPISEAAAYPVESEARKMPGWTNMWMGDVWKTIVYLRALRADLKVFVLDYDCGLGIIKKGEPETRLEYSEKDIAHLTYQDFEKNKAKLLNLKSGDYFNNFLDEQARF